MGDVLKDLQVEIDGLRYEIAAARKNSKDFAKRHFNGTRENALVFCLARAADTAEGCDLVGSAKLLAPLYTLTRSLLESLIWVCWIVKSDENAQIFVEAAGNELKRIARKNLATGAARARDRVTGENRTQELLASDWFEGTPRRLRIEDSAKACGLETVYTQFYTPLSMYAHGSVFGFEPATTEAALLESVAVMQLANVLLECINLVVERWIVKRKQTSAREVYAVLVPPRNGAR